MKNPTVGSPEHEPVRVGIFDTVGAADRAVRGLLAAGFRKEELAVICSDKYKEQFFADVPTPDPAGRHAAEGVVAGALTGATLGGLALAVTALTAGAAGLLMAGTVLVGGGALAGSFAGAMMTRGFEKSAADFYDQAVQSGQILVAVEVHGPDARARLAEAERILHEAGAVPVPLVEG
jgi:hypothetical protein